MKAVTVSVIAIFPTNVFKTDLFDCIIATDRSIRSVAAIRRLLASFQSVQKFIQSTQAMPNVTFKEW